MEKICIYPDCERATYSLGLCPSHYNLKRLGKPLRPIRSRRPNGSSLLPCKVEMCDGLGRSSGYCSAHSEQLRTHGAIQGLIKRNKPGEWGAWGNKEGYIIRQRTLPGGVKEGQLQHRWVMEQYLGRPLLPHENVHHINGARDQNNIENLQLWSTSQPAGQRAIDKLNWAREIIALYEKDEDKL